MKSLSLRPWSIVVLLVAAIPTAAQSPDEALIERLETTIVDADWVAVDFENIIAEVRQAHGLNIHVSWRLLDELGIRKDMRLEVRLQDVTLATVLDMVLREAEPQPGLLGYAADGGVILISTRDALARYTDLRPYDVTDLIESGYAIRRFGNTPVLTMELTGREFLGGEVRRAPRGGVGPIFGDPTDERSRLSRMERLQELLDLLTETIDPGDWLVNGGSVASIRVYKGTLLVRHTIDGHRRVKAVLELLRQQMPAVLDGEAVVVRLRADRAAQWRRELAGTFPRLSGDDVARLTAEGEAGSVLFRGTTSGFNGQAMWFSALTQRDVVTTVKTQTAEQINAFTPVTGFVTEGLELIVLPLLCNGEDAMLLDVQMAWVPGTAVTARDVTLGGGDAIGSIDQTRRSMRTVSTTAKVNADEGLVLTIPYQLDDAGRAAEYEDWLVLYVRAPKVAPDAHAAAVLSAP